MNVGIFVASLGSASVEFFETAAIAYAIFRSGYPREAIWGTITGLMGVGIVSALMGTGLQYIPIRILQVAIGLVLLWFGWGWYKNPSCVKLGINGQAGSQIPWNLKALHWKLNAISSVSLTFW